MNIGDWVKRGYGKWHVVESVVAGDAITRCGKRMADWPDSHGPGKLQVSGVMPLTRMIGQPQLCKAGCEDKTDDGLLPGLMVGEPQTTTTDFSENDEDRAALVEDIARHSTTPSAEFATLDEATAGLDFEDDASTQPETIP